MSESSTAAFIGMQILRITQSNKQWAFVFAIILDRPEFTR